MRILHVIDSLKSGGKERQLIELLKGLKDYNDIKVAVVILSDDIKYDYIFNLRVDIDIIKRKRKRDFSIFRQIYSICKDFKPDIIHSWEFMCSVYSIPIAKMFGARFINGIIRYSPSDFSIFKNKWSLLTKASFFFSDAILSNSFAGLRAYRVPKSKSFCIHNGFDLDRIRNVKTADYINDRHNLRTKNIVGMVARFHGRKNYPMFIQSALSILESRNDVTFLMVGAGETLSYCKNLVPLKHRECVRFLGEQNDVESIINAFDIGVLVSHEEGISNSIMEYMALEKPVIATRHGGNDEIVENNITGFLIEPNDIDGLRDKLNYLLDNKNVARSMGKAGKVRLVNAFSLENMTNSYIQLCERCIGHRI